MRTYLTQAASILICLGTAGCVNYSFDGIRNSEPTIIRSFSGQYRAFAECLNFQLQEMTHRHLTFDNGRRLAALEVISPVNYPRLYITVNQETADQITLRLRQTIGSKNGTDKDMILRAANKCERREGA